MDKAQFMNRVFNGARVALTSPYGYRISPITGLRSFHYGEDYGTYRVKIALYSPVYGVVTEASYNVSRGNYITIKTPQGLVRMQHLTSKLVKVGKKVVQGQQVGVAGTTGASTGIHLHIEYKTLSGGAMDPAVFVPSYQDPIIARKKVIASALNVRIGAGATFVKANRTPNPIPKDTPVDIFAYGKDTSGKTWASINYINPEWVADWYLV